MDRASVGPDQLGAVVCVSSTGLAIPSLDARLSNRLKFNQQAERLPIFGLGCAGGTSGLARAARMSQSITDEYTLLLVVELAEINVHVNHENTALFVSTALFGDGAAAVLLKNDRAGREKSPENAGSGRRSSRWGASVARHRAHHGLAGNG